MSEIKLRPATTEDFNFITSSWIQSIQHKNIDFDTYRTYQNRLIKNILSRAITIVAVPDDMPEIITGWICLENNQKLTIHWLYVKNIYRKMGIAKKFIEKIQNKSFYFTHEPKNEHWLKKKIEEMNGQYCPYLAYEEMKYDNKSNQTNSSGSLR